MSIHNIPFLNVKKKIIPNHCQSASTGFVPRIKNEFETAVVNEPSVFETLKFHYNLCVPTGHTT